MSAFTLDVSAAKAADVKSSAITSAGKYKGKIVCAEYIENQEKGSKNIRIVFKSDAGQEAAFFLNLIHHHHERNEGGHKTMNAILACLKIKSTGNSQSGTVEKWSKLSQTRERVPAMVYPDMAGKEIGFVIQMEIEKTSENGYPRPIIYAPFEASTEKTASEVLANPPVMHGEMLAKFVQAVAERPLIDRRPKGGGNNQGFGSVPVDPFVDDDIPF